MMGRGSRDAKETNQTRTLKDYNYSQRLGNRSVAENCIDVHRTKYNRRCSAETEPQLHLVWHP